VIAWTTAVASTGILLGTLTHWRNNYPRLYVRNAMSRGYLRASPRKWGDGSGVAQGGPFIKISENAQVRRAAIGYSSPVRHHYTSPHTVYR
jgi:hypothetical protein